MSDVRVRRALPHEAQAVSALFEETTRWLLGRGIRQWTLRWRTATWCLEGIKRGELYVMLDGGGIVATFLLAPNDVAFGERPADALYLQGLCVRRTASGRQLGERIVAWCEEQTRQADRDYLRLDCVSDNSFLNGYYQRLSFTAIGTYVYDLPQGPLPCTLYEKPVSAGPVR